MRIVSIFLASLALTMTVSAQTGVRLSGMITNTKTGEPIPRASVMILGTSRGAIANTQGKYSIVLEQGRSHRLRIRAIGFRDDTVSITLSEATTRNFQLEEQPVTGAEVVVRGDASRVEARRIMREVIKRKKAWIDKLNDFTSKAYSRWNYRTISGGVDTVMRSVIESIADVYWKKGKGIAERIVARKQTANLPPEFNTFSVGQIQNFYDERIDFGDYNLTSPLAEDAFDVYDYDLLEKEVKLFGSTYSVIAVEIGPLSAGFTGKLWVDEADYSVGYLELEPNDAVEMGPINELRFEQRFDDIGGEFQLPIDLHMIVGVKLQLPFVPKFQFEQFSVLKDYVVNQGIHDSLFAGRRHSALPTADSASPAIWEAERAIPLTVEEESAYKRIDSTIALDKGDTVHSFFGDFLEVLPSPDLPAYNQVEGLRLGISKRITPVKTFPLTLSGELKYGFKDEAWKYRLRLEQGILWTMRKGVSVSAGLSGDFRGEYRERPDIILALGGDLYDVYHERGAAYASPMTSITSLIYKTDYQEFYRGRGFSLDLKYHASSRSQATVHYVSEKLTDVGTLHIVNDTSGNAPQQYNAIVAGLETGIDLGSADIGLNLAYSVTSKSLSSAYEFSRINAEVTSAIRLGALGRVELTGRYQTALSGTLPRWDLAFFETRNKFFSAGSYFRALDPFEFMGDRLWMLYAEHNFYDLPLRLFGIKLPEDIDLHWFVFGGMGEADFRSTALAGVHTTHDKPHAEIGVGIGNILNIIRLEGTWRLTHTKESNFYPTISIGFTF